MHYLGFDCHQKEHSWTLLDGNGQVVNRGVVANRARDLQRLRTELPEDMCTGLEGPRDLRRDVEWQFAGGACFEISPAWTHAIRQRSPLPDKDDLTDADRAALALYIESDRGASKCRAVFLRCIAPRMGLSGPAAIGHVVRRALVRAGLQRPPGVAAHLFRHSLATQMIRHGASLPEISEVLRHRSTTTTEIYAKVAFESLREVARPWPGAEVAR